MGFPLRPPLRTPGAVGLRCPALGALKLERRHLSENQRAMVAGRLANLEEGRPEKTAQICAVSQSDAAELMGVSVPSVKRAVAVQRDGAPELIAAVDAGQVSVSAAAGPDAMKNAAMDCTTVLVKGTSGRLKHAAGESRCLACCSATIYGACTD